MNYSLIGTGNMAWLMASRMLGAGHTCVGLWGRDAAAADELSLAYSLPKMHTLQELHDGADACILAVSDSAVPEIANLLSLRRTTLIHTAGSLTLQAIAGRCVHAGVVWPVYSIRKASLPVHRSFAALIEANTHRGWEIVRETAKAICDTTYEADGTQRQWLHLAAVIGNNFVNHLLSISEEICASRELPASLLQPLLEQTIAGIRTQPAAQLQTGPARRHDTATITRHLAMLAENPAWHELYNILTQAIMTRYPLPDKG